MPPPVKPPPGADDDEINEKSGRFNHGEYATWFGNALVLGSLGTLALIVNNQQKGRQRSIGIISDLLLATGVGVLIWSSAKYFLVGRKHHWSAYLFLFFLLATIAAFLWLSIVV
jgi:hypothetical protein